MFIQVTVKTLLMVCMIHSVRVWVTNWVVIYGSVFCSLHMFEREYHGVSNVATTVQTNRP